MEVLTGQQNCKRFLQASLASSLLAGSAAAAPDIGVSVFGPRSGYLPQIGILVSQMEWMRGAMLRATKSMTKDQLDFRLHNKANRINTFQNVGEAEFDKSLAFNEWGVPMELGEPARQAIKQHELAYYLDLLRDDQWLMSVDEKWLWGLTNNLCKWFHVCEHESHHAGQISLLKSRAPGAKAGNG